ncbi:MAG: hypothetical protein C0482_28765 [Gordonia sp.]|nr:hypothetical protein [Gordonia sp. (in: high G+C Gram-positive bacteria)]
MGGGSNSAGDGEAFEDGFLNCPSTNAVADLMDDWCIDVVDRELLEWDVAECEHCGGHVFDDNRVLAEGVL